MSKIKPAESDLKQYLQASYFIDCDHSLIQKTARQLTGSLAEAKIMAKTLFLFVRDEVRYNPYSFSTSREDYQAHSILSRGKGYCIQKAVLLAALCRAVSIPSRLRLANIRNYQVPAKLAEMMKTNIFYCHGYNEIQLDGRWLKATPTFDCFMCERLGINPVNFDGTKDAVFAARTLDGQPHIEYLKQWGPFSDLPFAEIMATFNDNYGKNMVQQWINAGEQHYD
ncbi:MAG: transglutaminase family protein [Pseudomonadota bacterium]|nr:transglutaminase family protein [Pseudomonadota bacterium]